MIKFVAIRQTVMRQPSLIDKRVAFEDIVALIVLLSMIISTVSVTMAIAESVSGTITKTISKTMTISISKTIYVGDRWWNRVSIMTVAHRWRRISWSIGHLCDGRCGVRYFGNGRCNGKLSDSWSKRDLRKKIILSVIVFYFIIFRRIDKKINLIEILN